MPGRILKIIENEVRIPIDPSNEDTDFYIMLPVTSTQSVRDPDTGETLAMKLEAIAEYLSRFPAEQVLFTNGKTFQQMLDSGELKGPPGAQGIAGPAGSKGDTGPAGTSAYVHIRWGTTATPGSLLTTPAEYIGIATSSSVTAPSTYTGYTWYNYKGEPGAKGDKGDTGAAGVTGSTGAAGVTYDWLTGAVAPASGTGKVGDMYLNTATMDVYKKTASTTWTLQCNIKGTIPDATASASGLMSAADKTKLNNMPTITMGTVAPTNPQNGDIWHDTNN